MTTMTTPTMQAAVFERDGPVALREVETPRREPDGVLPRLPALYRAAATFLGLCNQPATVYDP